MSRSRIVSLIWSHNARVGGDHPGRLALFGGQGEPAFGGFPANAVRFRLRYPVSELGERGLHFARKASPNRFPEIHVALGGGSRP